MVSRDGTGEFESKSREPEEEKTPKKEENFVGECSRKLQWKKTQLQADRMVSSPIRVVIQTKPNPENRNGELNHTARPGRREIGKKEENLVG